MILVIDNYDSFTFNLVQYLGELGTELQVYRNNQIDLQKVEKLKPAGIIISPGPGRPEQAGFIVPLIRETEGQIPILGVCLGHQAIGFAYGGKIVPAPKLIHGKTSEIFHRGNGLFHSIPNPFKATRYHSLIVARNSLPPALRITAETEDGIIMGLQHKNFPIFGLQFHPESILTVEGKKLLENFLTVCERIGDDSRSH